MLIKPSGLLFAELTPESMVQTDFAGTIIDGRFKPSSDTATHGYIYQHMPQVGVNQVVGCAEPCEAQPTVGGSCASYRQHNLRAALMGPSANLVPNCPSECSRRLALTPNS